MYKFNNNDIFTGYLKQVLTSFNLPKYRVYNEHCSPKTLIPTVCDTEYTTKVFPYIKDNKIKYWINNNWADISSNTEDYVYNVPVKNWTKKLIIQNNIYDDYTHEYFGDYLRFIRDYRQLDLMSMYNCFGNRFCNNLNITLNNSLFKSTDPSYKIFMLPVKFFQKYTIAIDSDFPVEIFCGIYDEYLSTTKDLMLESATYKKFSSLQFNQPTLYSNLMPESDNDINKLKNYAQFEHDLKLFIKLPIQSKSSIVILEGDYTNYTKDNIWITNYEDKRSFDTFKPVNELQLLRFNTRESYPFADRLIEYVIGNAITNVDDISDNVIRVQKVLALNSSYKSVFSGIWDKGIIPIIYDEMMKQKYALKIPFTKSCDILGYVDKTAEQNYAANIDENTSVTIANINIYDEEE